jgi:hypothetical protein
MLAGLLSAREIRVGSTEALRQAVSQASSGTRIIIAPGTCEGGFTATGLHGSDAAPIRIMAGDPERPPVFRGGDVAFGLSECSYVTVEGIVATAARINNVQISERSHHIILKDVQSTCTAGQGNCDGIKMAGVTDFLLYRCTVDRWGGEGSAIDMVGCAAGLIMQSTLTYPNLTGQTANAIQAKGGTHSLGVYRCRFQDASLRAIQFGGSTGRQYFFQGNVDTGYEGMDMVAMANTIVHGGAAIAYVSCVDCLAAYNTIIRPRRYVLRVLKEGGTKPTARNTFDRNLIVYGDVIAPLNTSSAVDLKSFRVQSNYWYNQTRPSDSVPHLPVAQTDAVGGTDPRLSPALVPAADGPAAAYGAHAAQIPKAWARHTHRFKWAWYQAKLLGGQ